MIASIAEQLLQPINIQIPASDLRFPDPTYRRKVPLAAQPLTTNHQPLIKAFFPKPDPAGSLPASGRRLQHPAGPP
jgi:hypothetical protein